MQKYVLRPVFAPKMLQQDRHSIHLRNHTTGDVFIDKLFQQNFSVCTFYIFIVLVYFRPGSFKMY